MVAVGARTVIAMAAGEIMLGEWDGSTWSSAEAVSLPNGGRSFGRATAPALAVNSDAGLFLAWQDDRTGNDEIYVRMRTSTAFVDLTSDALAGGVSNSSATSQRPNLAADENRVCVTWVEGVATTTGIAVRCARLR